MTKIKKPDIKTLRHLIVEEKQTAKKYGGWGWSIGKQESKHSKLIKKKLKQRLKQMKKMKKRR